MNVDVDARGDATRDDARLTRMTTMTTRRVDRLGARSWTFRRTAS
tara:strand:- start:536 stop:670 length:135 start_codon:yes stop_codon:yes gene_type:complete